MPLKKRREGVVVVVVFVVVLGVTTVRVEEDVVSFEAREMLP
jgi:hypothetical protein